MEESHIYNVLYISHEHGSVNGSTKSLCNMIHSLSSHVNATVVIPAYGKAYDFLTKNDIQCKVVRFYGDSVECQYNKWKYIFKVLPRILRSSIVNSFAIYKISKISKGLNINMVHSNSSSIDIGIKVAHKNHIKHVWHLREYLSLDHNYYPMLGWKNLKKKISKSDIIICISKSIRNHFELNECDKAVVIYNAVKNASFFEFNVNFQKQKYFLFCGTISKNKGVEVAINSFIRFNSDDESYKLYLVGNGKEQYVNYLKTVIAAAHIEDKVEWVGYVENCDRLMANATALLMCSKMEAMGRVTAEAMLLGCPVIGYDSGGTTELINDGITGFLYHDEIELVKKMKTVTYSNNETIINAARNFALDNFLEESYSAKIEELYSSLY